MKEPILSIIILNYNTKKVTIEAVTSIEQHYSKEVSEGEYELLIADNASTDGSMEAFTEYKKTSRCKLLLLIRNGKNLGFAGGNNAAILHAHGKYILLLNPDTVVYTETLKVMLRFMQNHPDAGAATCKVTIPGGGIDEASHRGFPTPWNAFCHFSGLEKIFPKTKVFDGYRQGWKDFTTTHEVDAIVGAFMIVPKKVGDEVGWLDEDYFFYGEDLDFCYMLHERGYKVYYVPEVSILHYGGVSSGIKKQSSNITTANIETKRIVQNARFDAMRIFYKKHYQSKYPLFITWMVEQGITLLHKKNIPTIPKSD